MLEKIKTWLLNSAVYTTDSEEQELTMLGLLSKIVRKTNEVVDETNLKTDLNGDHKGTWQGYRPSQASEATTAILEQHTQNIADLNSSLNAASQLTLLADINGTSYKTGQKVDIEDLRSVQIKKLAMFNKKMRNAEVVKINTKGDSLTYGVDVYSSDRRSADVVPCDNGTTHADNRASKTYPEALQEFLFKVNQNILVVNKGYSGDCVQYHYNRWYKQNNADLSLIMLGTNDALTNANWLPPGTPGNVEEYIKWYEQLIIRELLWGTAVIILTPPKKQDLEDRSLDMYRKALYNLGQKYCIPVIDTNELLANLNYDIYSDSTHFNGKGYTILAARISAYILNLGKQTKVSYGSKLMGRSSQDGVIYAAGSSYSPVAGGLTPTEATVGQSISSRVNNNGSMYYSFYAENDDMYVFPWMYLSSNTSVNLSLDFGTEQGRSSIDIANKTNPQPIIPSVAQYNGSGRDIYPSHVIAEKMPVLHIVKKGWHTIQVTCTGDFVMLHGIEFTDLKGTQAPKITGQYFKTLYDNWSASTPAVNSVDIPLSELQNNLGFSLVANKDWNNPVIKLTVLNAGCNVKEYAFVLPALNGSNVIFLGELRTIAYTNPPSSEQRSVTGISYNQATQTVTITFGGTLTAYSNLAFTVL